MYTVEALRAEIEAAEEGKDLAKLEELEAAFRPAKSLPPVPFRPAIEFDPRKVASAGTLESDTALPVANQLARAQRRLRYNLKIFGGYDGPRIVAEGDSWFEYPILLDDVLDQLSQYAIFSVAGAGDLIADMAAVDEYSQYIESEQADFFMISGGGNDILHDGELRRYLKPYVSGMSAADVFEHDIYQAFVDGLLATYQQMFNAIATRFPRTAILCHGYDYVIPRKKGPSLGGPLAERKVPESLWSDVVKILIDTLNVGLKSLETNFAGHVYHVDCRTVVGGAASWHDELHPKNPGYARVAAKFAERIESIMKARSLPVGGTELERVTPSPGLLKVARQGGRISRPEVAAGVMRSGSTIAENLRPALASEAIIAPRPTARTPSSASTPGSVRPSTSARMPAAARTPAGNGRAATTAAILRAPAPIPNPALVTPPPLVGDVAADSALAAWQAQLDEEDWIAFRHYEEIKAHQDEPDSDEAIETRRELLAGNDVYSLERIIGRSDIFQVNYLERGLHAAQAVGRISVLSKYGVMLGFGTGFLVGPGLLLTNNHVLEDVSYVDQSFILFDYQYDAKQGLRQTERFALTPEVFFTSKRLDCTFVSVAAKGTTGRALSEFGKLTLIRESGKALKGEYISIIQHANGLPKQIAFRDSQILGRKQQYIYYTTDTNPGSSGAPVVSDEWFPVALHHRSVPNVNVPYEYVANRGIRISSIFTELDSAAGRNDAMARQVLDRIEPKSPPRVRAVASQLPSGVFQNGNGAATEAVKEPYHEDFTIDRDGYDEDFLGVPAPLPTAKHPQSLAKRLDKNSRILTYEHFSLVVHRKRRLALFTASNVDARPAVKEPEPGVYTRKGLGGLGRNDIEKWFEDPRLASSDQLPDRFFTKDQGAFDRGHLVRREDVTWGTTYAQIRRANGDTFHVTNCSPQVKGFNQSSYGGLWGELENLVLDQAESERYSLFAGPVLDPSDQSFAGVDDEGDVLVQIPSKYWKVVLANQDGGLAAFAFLLEQDLSDVPLEFQVDAEWVPYMISIPELEVIVRHFRFPQAVHDADQYASHSGELVRSASRLERFSLLS